MPSLRRCIPHTSGPADPRDVVHGAARPIIGGARWWNGGMVHLRRRWHNHSGWSSSVLIADGSTGMAWYLLVLGPSVRPGSALIIAALVAIIGKGPWRFL